MGAPVAGRVIVVGSINRDIVARVGRLPSPGETVPGWDLEFLPGGKGANQAVAAARAGGRVCFVGAVGADEAGVHNVTTLRAEGIDTREIRVVEGVPSGTAVIFVADTGENEIVIIGGANAHVTGAAVLEALQRIDVTHQDVILTNFEIPDDAVDATVEYGAAVRCRLIVNPAPARPLTTALRNGRVILTPNRVESLVLTGLDDVHAAARALAEQTGAPVVVTLGSDGALLADMDGDTHIAARQVPVVDTTGAGDVFVGVLAAEVAADVPLRSAVRRAVVAASLSVSRPGARAAPSLAELDAAMTAGEPDTPRR